MIGHLEHLKPGDRVEFRRGPDVIVGTAKSGVIHSPETTYHSHKMDYPLRDGWVTVPQATDTVRVEGEDGRYYLFDANAVVIV